MHRFLLVCRDLENRVGRPSRSLEMSPFDRGHISSYWRSIVTMAPSRVVSEILSVEKYHDLEIRVRGHSTSLKLVGFDRLGLVSYYCTRVTLSLRCTLVEIFDFKNAVTVKPGYGSVKVIGHVPIRQSTWLPIDVITMAVSRVVFDWDIQCWKISWPRNTGQRSLKVTERGTIR